MRLYIDVSFWEHESTGSEIGKLFPFPSATCQSHATLGPLKELRANAVGIIRSCETEVLH